LNWQSIPEGVNMHDDQSDVAPRTPGSVVHSSTNSSPQFDNRIINKFTADELLDRMLMGT